MLYAFVDWGNEQMTGRGGKKMTQSHLQSVPLVHSCCRSVKTNFFFFFFLNALWHLTHTHLAQRTFAHPEGSMESQGVRVWPFYFGQIGSQATERLLERFGQDGSYLLRDSDTVQGLYCLCVRWVLNLLHRLKFFFLLLESTWRALFKMNFWLELLTWISHTCSEPTSCSSFTSAFFY